MTKLRRVALATIITSLFAFCADLSFAQTAATPASAEQTRAAADKLVAKKPQSEFPPVDKVTKGYKEVKSADGKTPYIKLWMSEKKDGQMLAELPRDYASPKHRTFIATTVSSGEQFAGLQNSDFYIYWKKVRQTTGADRRERRDSWFGRRIEVVG